MTAAAADLLGALVATLLGLALGVALLAVGIVASRLLHGEWRGLRDVWKAKR